MYLLIITGLSGAGKSQALHALEDVGFFCVDNLPCEMMESFAKLCKTSTPPIERVAVIIDSRESVFKSDLEKTFNTLDKLDVCYEIAFLDCSDEVLERRFNETRRMHPLSMEIRKGIAEERKMLKSLQDRANYIIDTSDKKPVELNNILRDVVGERADEAFAIMLQSFGYRRGLPNDSDLVFDTRFLPNPYYEKDLRYLSGRDKRVRDFIIKDETYLDMIDTIEQMLIKLIPKYKQEGKHRLVVSFGCTGGRHRSVCAAQEMYERMRDKYDSKVIHRDEDAEAADIIYRHGEADTD